MRKNYTLIFAQNNVKKDENYLLDLSEIERNEKFVEKAIEKVVFIPRQNIVDKIIAFAKAGKE
jgi:hypothetical protein